MATSTMQFKIYRYDPDKDAAPYMQDISVEVDFEIDRKLLDILTRLKAKDDTLSYRRSCREGICGSDAMNINGKNGLACLTEIKELKQPVVLRPLAGPAGDPRPDRRYDAVFQAVSLGQAVSDQRQDRARSVSGCSRPRSAKNSTVSTSASCAPAVRPRVLPSGGIRTSSSARPVC
jgi:hypothetical protein